MGIAQWYLNRFGRGAVWLSWFGSYRTYVSFDVVWCFRVFRGVRGDVLHCSHDSSCVFDRSVCFFLLLQREKSRCLLVSKGNSIMTL